MKFNWVAFDTSNGSGAAPEDGGRLYFWLFPTLAAAKKFLKNGAKYGGSSFRTCIGPYKWKEGTARRLTKLSKEHLRRYGGIYEYWEPEA